MLCLTGLALILCADAVEGLSEPPQLCTVADDVLSEADRLGSFRVRGPTYRFASIKCSTLNQPQRMHQFDQGKQVQSAEWASLG